ncbi:hypothetical protein BD626DRAFT_633024 [Schizophyllum amplum]|uniref:Uncharacterized protein n=1 Tax=Schizophyllum amplum TaxID=97359 RepID=A0A550C4Q6_9AGAR|nr:hypothetical protein BD626DRAFT_633024 [Auriculariopsis ampla]
MPSPADARQGVPYSSDARRRRRLERLTTLVVYKSRGTWGDRGSTPAFSPSSLTCPPVVGFFLLLSPRRRRTRLDVADLASTSPPFRAYSPPPPASSTASYSRPTVALDDAQHLLFVGEVDGHCECEETVINEDMDEEIKVVEASPSRTSRPTRASRSARTSRSDCVTFAFGALGVTFVSVRRHLRLALAATFAFAFALAATFAFLPSSRSHRTSTLQTPTSARPTHSPITPNTQRRSPRLFICVLDLTGHSHIRPATS